MLNILVSMIINKKDTEKNDLPEFVCLFIDWLIDLLAQFPYMLIRKHLF